MKHFQAMFSGVWIVWRLLYFVALITNEFNTFELGQSIYLVRKNKYPQCKIYSHNYCSC